MRDQVGIKDQVGTRGKVRIRAILAGMILGLVICAFTPYNNAYLNATHLAGGHFPLAPFFILVWLCLGFALIARLTKKSPLFSGMELLVTWAIMLVVSGLGYTGLVRTFFVNLTAPYYFATYGNRWQEVLQPLLPSALYPQDKAAIETLYNGVEGGAGMGLFELIGHIPWGAWITPLLVWGGFILLAYFVMICLVNLFSRQWVVNERVNFPLLRVPQLLSQAYDEQWLGGFFLNRFFLVGLACSFGLHIVNGLSFYFPEIPPLPTEIPVGSYFGKYGLFSGFYKLKIYLIPAFIGFAFLTTRQISFSCWFFFLLGGLAFGALGTFGLQIPDAALGVVFGPGLARPDEAQSIGAYMVFFLFIIWLARFHLKEALFGALGRGASSPPSRAEWLPLGFSLWGLVLGLAAMMVFSVWVGIPLMAAFLTLAAFMIMLLVATRIVCQGGMPIFTLTAAPSDGILALLGSRIFGGVGLVISMVMQKLLFVDMREALIPSLMHGAKVTEEAGRKRMIFAGFALVLLLGVATAFVSMLVVSHKFGMRELGLDWATQTTLNVYENAQRLVESPSGPRQWVLIFAGVGALVMLLLVMAYQRFYWWPIHPLGYLVAYGWSMRILWFSFLLGWLCNHLCLHYGGANLFKKVRFFFIGLIVGDFLMGGIWALVGCSWGRVIMCCRFSKTGG
jgi:hypothetical protein